MFNPIIRFSRGIGRWLLLPAVIFVATLLTPAHAASIAQGYQSSDTELVIGMAAALDVNPDSEGRLVARASIQNPHQFVGIVTTKDANFLTLTSTNANVVVATSGEVATYVTDTNGPIKKGDNVTISPIRGVLMRAGENSSRTFATALEDFTTVGATKQEGSAYDGSGRDIFVTTMRVELNPRSISDGTSSDDQSLLKTLGENLTGRALREWQVIVSLVIFILLLVVEAALIYGTVHSTIVSLGRNPLSKEAVYKQLLQVALMVLALLAFGIAVIYAILQI
jgi:hypothetical protein